MPVTKGGAGVGGGGGVRCVVEDGEVEGWRLKGRRKKKRKGKTASRGRITR